MRGFKSILRSGAAAAVMVTIAGTGCASLGSAGDGATRASLAYDPGDELRTTLPVFAASTQLEREAPPADDRPRNEKVTPALFWTGIIAGSLGTAGTVGFGLAGRVTENKVHDGYEDGFTRAESDELRDKGSTYNTLAITSAVVGVVGWATALIVYGIDYSRCGPVAKKNKKRNCPE
jgi:hypothetical protein